MEKVQAFKNIFVCINIDNEETYIKAPYPTAQINVNISELTNYLSRCIETYLACLGERTHYE